MVASDSTVVSKGTLEMRPSKRTATDEGQKLSFRPSEGSRFLKPPLAQNGLGPLFP